MEYRVLKNNDEIYVLELRGRMDLYSSNQVKDLVMKLIENKIEGLIVDLEKVDAINSAGIGALIYISSTLKKLNCALALTKISNVVEKTMTVTKLTGYMPITQTLKEAIDLIKTTA